MKIGYTTAASTPTAIALSDGMWLTLDAGAGCYDCSPASKSRLLWRDDETPAIGHYVDLTLTLAAAGPIGICAFLGVDLPVGTVVHVYGKRTVDASATYDFGGQNTGTIVEFGNGTRGAWFVLPTSAQPVEQVAFRIYNDVAGSTWAQVATTIDIGELVAMPAAEIQHEQNWDMPLVDPSAGGRSRASQSYVSRRTPYRRLQAALAPELVSSVRGGALANGMDWARLAAAFTGRKRMAAIVRTVSAAEINATAIYGTAALSGERHAAGDYYSASIAVEEEPAI